MIIGKYYKVTQVVAQGSQWEKVKSYGKHRKTSCTSDSKKIKGKRNKTGRRIHESVCLKKDNERLGGSKQKPIRILFAANGTCGV